MLVWDWIPWSGSLCQYKHPHFMKPFLLGRDRETEAQRGEGFLWHVREKQSGSDVLLDLLWPPSGQKTLQPLQVAHCSLNPAVYFQKVWASQCRGLGCKNSCSPQSSADRILEAPWSCLEVPSNKA